MQDRLQALLEPLELLRRLRQAGFEVQLHAKFGDSMRVEHRAIHDLPAWHLIEQVRVTHVQTSSLVEACRELRTSGLQISSRSTR